MRKSNFYDGVRKLLDKIADALDPDSADVKTANYQTAVLNSLERIGDKVGDVVDATLPDPSAATDGDVLVVDDGEWTIGSGGGGGGGIDLGITDASAGEYAKIKTVDANGVPTAWESGSGGGGGTGVFTVNMIVTGNTTTLDKTYAEISAAALAGSVINVVSVGSYDDVSFLPVYYVGIKQVVIYVPNTQETSIFTVVNDTDYPTIGGE